MKLIRIHHSERCRTCGIWLGPKVKAWKVSEGCNPKYYCLKDKPKEY